MPRIAWKHSSNLAVLHTEDGDKGGGNIVGFVCSVPHPRLRSEQWTAMLLDDSSKYRDLGKSDTRSEAQRVVERAWLLRSARDEQGI